MSYDPLRAFPASWRPGVAPAGLYCQAHSDGPGALARRL